MRVRRAAAVAALVVVFGIAPAGAQHLDRELDLRLTVGADAVVTVHESLTFRPRIVNPVAERTIPLRTSDRRLLRVRDITATAGDGTPLRVGIAEREDEIVVRTRDTLGIDAQGDVRLDLSYRTYRAVRQGDAGQWLEWTIVPWSWQVKRLRVSVGLPSTLARTDTVDVLLTRGKGEAWPAEITRTARGVALTSVLPPQRVPLRILVSWPGSHVNLATPEPPVPWASRLRFDTIWVVPGVLFGIAGLVAAGRRWSAGGVVPSYAPPPSLRAGEAGVLIDGRVDTEDVVAAVVDLAVRGYLRLEPNGDDLLVSIARPWLHDRDLRPFEDVLLAHVFTDGVHSVRLSELRGQGVSPTSIKNTLSIDLAERGYFYAPPRAVRQLGGVLALAGFGIWIQMTLNARGVVATFLTGIFTGGGVWLLLHLLCVGGPTAKGRRARQELRGYAEYLRRVERDRIDRLTPGSLDEHLPWAIALGVSSGWLKATPHL